MRKQIIASVAAVSTVVLALAGCGSTSSSSAPSNVKVNKGLPTYGDTVKYDPNHLVNNGKKITLEYWSWGDAKSDPVHSEIKRYEKLFPNVHIKSQLVSWDDYWTKLPLALRGNNGPALFNIHNSHDDLIRPYAADYDIPVSQLEKDYTGVAAHVVNGKVKYIDDVINTGNIYYNKDMWKAAGLTDNDIPKTWDQFVEVAKKLTKTEGGKITQAGFNFNGDAYAAIFEGLNYQKGELLYKDGGKVANFNNSVTKENLKFLQSMYTKDHVGSADFGNSYSDSFGRGQTAMIYAWGWLVGTMADKYPNINYGVFPTPTFSTKTPFAYDRYNGESTPGINAHQSKEQQAVAQDFIKFILADPAYIRTAVKELNSFPAKKSLQKDKEILKNPVMDAIAPRVNRLIWPGPSPATIEDTSKIVISNVMNNGMAIDTAVKQGQEKMDQDMQGGSFRSVENKYKFYSERRK